MKKMMTLYIDPYRALVFVFLGVSSEEAYNYVMEGYSHSKSVKLLAEMIKKEIESLKGGGYEGSSTVYEQFNVGMISLNNFNKNSPSCMNSIVHESFHMITDLFQHYGIKLSNKSNEAYAYSLGDLVEQIFDNLQNKKREL